MDSGAKQLTADVDLEGEGSSETTPVDLHDPAQRASVEHALRSLPGILGARLVPGYEREVDEVHILASTDKSPKIAVRDVQSLLMAKFAVTTDHRVISVVQLDEHDAAAARQRRVMITEVTVTQQGLQVAVKVAVNDEGTPYQGQATGPSSGPGRRRAVGRATLEAIRPLLNENRVVEIEGVEVEELMGRGVALCLVHFHTVNGEQTNCGSAMVRGDEAEAVARAVLDAVNRSIAEADEA